MNLPAQLSTLQQNIADLTSRLAPMQGDEIAKILAGLMNGGMMFPASIMAQDKIGEYRKALADVPSTGLLQVYRKLKRGEYEHINLAFIPLPNEFAAMARAEAKTARDDLARLRETAKAIEDQRQPAPVKDEGVVARIKARLAKARQEFAAHKATTTIAQEPMSDERAAELSKMMSLRDADNISAEQLAFQRAIAKQVNAVSGGQETT